MGELQALLEHHGLTLVFFNVLIEQAGLPVPAYPILLVAGALGVQGTGPSIGAVLTAVVAACLIADTLWYFAGRRIGQPMLRTICKVSLSQDSCIRQTQSLYLRLGPRSLIFAKLLPGAGALSTAMAGMTATPFALFLFYDALGAVVWAGAGLMIGAAFSNAIDAVLARFSDYGHIAMVVLGVALALFIAWRWALRARLMRRTRRIPRMTVDELEARRAEGRLPVVLDVRMSGDRTLERIVGALAVDPESPFDHLTDSHKSSDIVIYCACPNEMSAALLAERLRAAGYPNTWALAGGFDAWKRMRDGAPGSAVPRSGTPSATPSSAHFAGLLDEADSRRS